MSTLTLEKLRLDIAEILGEDPSAIGDNDHLPDLGLDSMRIMSLLMQWDAEGISVDFTELTDHSTLAGWWSLIGRAA